MQANTVELPLATLAILLANSLLLALPLAGEEAAASSTEAQSPAARAFALIQQGQYKQAIKTCRRVTSQDEAAARCHLATAIASAHLGREQDTISAAEQVIEMSKDDVVLSRAYLELGNARVSQQSSKQLPTLSPKAPESSLRLLEQAEQAYRQSMSLRPDAAQPRIALADTLVTQMLEGMGAERHDEVREILEPLLETGKLGDYQAWAESLTCRGGNYADLRIETEPGTGSERSAAEEVAEPSEADGAKVNLKPVQLEQVVTPPKQLNMVPPEYPELARQARIQGKVIVKSIIDKHGKVGPIWIEQGLPLCLTEEAVWAVKQWQYEPARMDGEPVDVFFNLTLHFRLE